MFGYIFPEKPELKVKEYDMFRAFYCGVCKSIGTRYGQIPRLTLNYDSTFLAVLLSSIVDENVSISREKCVVHPLRRNNVVKYSRLIDYASDMNIVLAYYNFKDDWFDERSIMGIAGATALKSAFGKIERKHYEKCAIIRKWLEELRKLEAEKCDSMDRAAEPFAKLMEEITAFDGVCGDTKKEKILRWLGYNVGKWIYLLDAYDDIERDLKKNTYNPLVYQFHYKGEDPETFKKSIRQRMEFNLTFTLCQISKAYELLEVRRNTGLIENIIYMGMLRKTEQILKIGSCNKIEKSV